MGRRGDTSTDKLHFRMVDENYMEFISRSRKSGLQFVQDMSIKAHLQQFKTVVIFTLEDISKVEERFKRTFQIELFRRKLLENKYELSLTSYN